MSQEKIFAGSCKAKETAYGELISIGFNEDDLNKLKGLLKGGWVNLTLKRSQKDNAPYLEVYQGNGGSVNSQQKRQAQHGDTVRPTKQDMEKNINQACEEDDLPF